MIDDVHNMSKLDRINVGRIPISGWPTYRSWNGSLCGGSESCALRTRNCNGFYSGKRHRIREVFFQNYCFIHTGWLGIGRLKTISWSWNCSGPASTLSQSPFNLKIRQKRKYKWNSILFGKSTWNMMRKRNKRVIVSYSRREGQKIHKRWKIVFQHM